MSAEYRELSEITEARFQAEQMKLRDILEKERRLRAQAADLEEAHRAALTHYGAETAGQRAYGGDVLWQGWVGRARRQLQMELARVLVEKGQRLGTVNRAHGRKLASESLEEGEAQRQRIARQNRQIEQEQALLLLKRWNGD